MEKINMINDLIKEYEVKTGISFTGDLKLNGRLTRTLGRCITISIRDNITNEILSIKQTIIEISKQFLDVATEKELKDVVAHEYAHYCTFKKIGEHNHNSKEFKRYCDLLKTSNKATMYLTNEDKDKYDIFCSCCNQHIASRNNPKDLAIRHPEYFTSPCCDANLEIVNNY